MKIFISGIGGFLGSRLAGRFLLGCQVSGCDRDADAARRLPVLRATHVLSHSLGDPIPFGMFSGADVVLHCAHDLSRGKLHANVAGTRSLREAASRSGVGRQIYVSSYSARAGAQSEYARSKHIIETDFLASGDTVVRPGLVLGNGGLFGRNMRVLRRLPLVPLLDGGRDLLPVIGIADFTRAVQVIIEQKGAGAYNLFHPDLVTMRHLIEELNRVAGHRAVYCSINAAWTLRLIRLCSRFGLHLPVDADNLRALKQNQAPVHESHLPGLIDCISGLHVMLSATLQHSNDDR